MTSAQAFTISDAARHCGVDRRTLQRAIRSGRLALTPDHHLTPEALAQAGYMPTAVSLALASLDASLSRIEALALRLRDRIEAIDRCLRGGSLYAIGILGMPYVKIGNTTGDVRQRLRALQAGSPLPLSLIAALQIQADPLAVERHIHAALRPYRTRGEWYEVAMDAHRLEALVAQAAQTLWQTSHA